MHLGKTMQATQQGLARNLSGGEVMSKTEKIMAAIPLPNRVIKWGAVAAAISSMLALGALVGLPTPMLSNSPEIKAVVHEVDQLEESIEEVIELRDADREQFLSRAIRDNKRELYQVINQKGEEPDNTALQEQEMLIEEELDEMVDERKRLRKKKGD
jgi:hypothetical protein